MLEYLDGFRTSLVTHLNTTDDFIQIPYKMVQRLNDMEDGNYVYLTIRYLDRYEVVKYTKDQNLKGQKVPVDRDSLGKGRKNFPCGACVAVDWNSLQMKDFICQNKCEKV